jgi:hypothetical protein
MVRRVARVGALVVLAVSGIVAGRVWYVHDQFWEWALVPSAAPPKLVVADRDYRWAGPVPPEPGLGPVAVGPRGAAVVAVPGGDVPVVVVLRTADGPVGYVLMGGP